MLKVIHTENLNQNNSSCFPPDAVCDVNAPTELNVVIKDGDSFLYKTLTKRRYGHNMDCLVTYELDDSCAEMELHCNKINIKNGDWVGCSNGDKLEISNDDGVET